MNTAETIAPIGHNSAAVGEMIEADPSVIYREEGLVEQLLAAIQQEIDDQPVDLKTTAGRKALASLSRSISTRKVQIETAGKALTEEHRKAVSAVNDIKKVVVDGMDALRDKARAPLDAWERAEDERASRADTIEATIATLPQQPLGATVADIDAALEEMKAIGIDEATFRNRKEAMEEARTRGLDILWERRLAAVKAPDDAAELARLRKADEDRQAAEAAAEQKRQDDARKAEAKAAEEQRAADAAKKAAADAEARVRAEQEAERLAEQQAADAKVAAAEKAQRDAEQALADQEAKRVADEAAAAAAAEAEAAETAKRERSTKHRAAVMGRAEAAVMQYGTVSPEASIAIVKAIVAGKVPGVTLEF